MDSPSLSPAALHALLLNGGIVAACGYCAWLWSDGQRDRMKLVLGAVLGCAALTALVAVWAPSQVPADWYTPLQEGNSRATIAGLHGRGAHAGENLRGLQELVAGRSWLRAGDVMRANVWFSALAAVLFLFIARFALAAWWPALAFTAVLAGNRVAVDAAVSELPGPLLACYTMLGVVVFSAHRRGVDRGRDPAERPESRGFRGVRLATAAPLVAMALLIAAAALTRVETLLLPAMALVAMAAELALGEERLAAAGRRLLWLLRWIVQLPWPALLLLLAVLTTPWWSNPMGGHAQWVLDAAWPLNLSAVLLPWWATQAIPVVAVLLAVCGLIAGLRRPIATGLLAVSVLLLWRLYYTAGHGFRFELHRYGTMLLPPLLVVALLGWGELVRWLGRMFPRGGWRKPAIAIGLTLLFVDAGYGVQRQAYQLEHKRQLMQGNLQVEARWLLAHVRRRPEAVFVAPVLSSPHRRSVYLLFGQPLHEPVELPAQRAALDAWLHHNARGKPALLYRGRDCFLRRAPSCEDAIAGLPPVDEMTLESRPYNHYHHGVHAPYLTLGLYELRP